MLLLATCLRIKFRKIAWVTIEKIKRVEFVKVLNDTPQFQNVLLSLHLKYKQCCLKSLPTYEKLTKTNLSMPPVLPILPHKRLNMEPLLK